MKGIMPKALCDKRIVAVLLLFAKLILSLGIAERLLLCMRLLHLGIHPADQADMMLLSSTAEHSLHARSHDRFDERTTSGRIDKVLPLFGTQGLISQRAVFPR
jgi:hypothetical protein